MPANLQVVVKNLQVFVEDLEAFVKDVLVFLENVQGFVNDLKVFRAARDKNPEVFVASEDFLPDFEVFPSASSVFTAEVSVRNSSSAIGGLF